MERFQKIYQQGTNPYHRNSVDTKPVSTMSFTGMAMRRIYPITRLSHRNLVEVLPCFLVSCA